MQVSRLWVETISERLVVALMANIRLTCLPILISLQITYPNSLWAGKIITKVVMIGSRDSHLFLTNLARLLKIVSIFKTKFRIIQMECKMIKWLWVSHIVKAVRYRGIWVSTHGCHPCLQILKEASVIFLVEILCLWTLLQMTLHLQVIKKANLILKVCLTAFQMEVLMQLTVKD